MTQFPEARPTKRGSAALQSAEAGIAGQNARLVLRGPPRLRSAEWLQRNHCHLSLVRTLRTFPGAGMFLLITVSQANTFT